MKKIKDSIIAQDGSKINNISINKSKIHKTSFWKGFISGILSSLIASLLYNLIKYLFV